MRVRGAPLIGAAAAYGLALALKRDPSDAALERAYALLLATRPTAVNLKWALDEIVAAVRNHPHGSRARRAFARAAAICDEDVETCRKIGVHGLALIRAAAEKKSGPVNVLTHCNAGWLACVDWGTALAPIYMAHDEKIPGPCLGGRDAPAQSGRGAHGFRARRARCGAHHHRRQCRRPSHAAGRSRSLHRRHRPRGGQRRRREQDRHLSQGARGASDNNVPFYVALPHTTIDWTLERGDLIPIEERGADEVLKITGRLRRRHACHRLARRAGKPRYKSRLRCHARAPRHGAYHRARCRSREPRRPARAYPERAT